MSRPHSPISASPVIARGDQLRRILIAPHPSVEDIGRRGRAQLLATLTLLFGISVLVGLLFGPKSIGSFLAIFAVAAISYLLSRTHYFNIGALLFALALTLYPVISLFFGVTGDFQTTVDTFIPIALILASAILTRASFIVVGLVTTLSVFLGPILMSGPLDQDAMRSGGLVLSIAIVLYSIGVYRENLEKSRLEQQQLLTNQLEKMKSELEYRVEERTSELSLRTDELALRSGELESANQNLQRRSSQFEAISNVSRAISSIRDLESLLPNVTELISQQFGFYHTGIFLLDEAGQYAVLRAANSEGGQRMLSRAHRLLVGEQGIVGLAAGTGRPRIALDVGTDAAFFNNPDLPETHSEMALPLKSGQKVIGALDVQSRAFNAFDQDDLDLLGVLADQVSLAIENARLFDEAQRSLAEAEAFSRQYLREGWSRLTSQNQVLGYRYDVAGTVALTRPIPLPVEDSGSVESLGKDHVSVPIMLRGEVIGNLVVQTSDEKKWSDDELDLIRAVADRVALSAENARLFEETSRRAERERMVSEITSKIRSSNDPAEMIQLAVQELKNALGVSRIDVIPQRASAQSGHQDA